MLCFDNTINKTRIGNTRAIKIIEKNRTVNDQMGRNTDKTAGWTGDEVQKEKGILEDIKII